MLSGIIIVIRELITPHHNNAILRPLHSHSSAVSVGSFLPSFLCFSSLVQNYFFFSSSSYQSIGESERRLLYSNPPATSFLPSCFPSSLSFLTSLVSCYHMRHASEESAAHEWRLFSCRSLSLTNGRRQESRGVSSRVGLEGRK